MTGLPLPDLAAELDLPAQLKAAAELSDSGQRGGRPSLRDTLLARAANGGRWPAQAIPVFRICSAIGPPTS
jgi:hypothetical protein